MPPKVPRNVTIYFWSEEYTGTPLIPRAIRYGGPIFPMIGDAGPEWDLDHRLLTVEGHPYGFDIRTGERKVDDGHYSGMRYTLLEGWQVLVGTGPHDLLPELPFPLADREAAEARARRRVTQNLMIGTNLRAEVVWQDWDKMGNPVAYIDGAEHTMTDAIKAGWEKEDLPIVRLEPKTSGGAASPPDDKEEHCNHASAPEQDQYTTTGEPRQVTLIVYYKAKRMPVPTETKGMGKLHKYLEDDREATAPARNLFEIRTELHRCDYRPDYPKWYVKNGSKYRREVWALMDEGRGIERVDLSTWTPAPRTLGGARMTKAQLLAKSEEMRIAEGRPRREPWETSESDRALRRLRSTGGVGRHGLIN